MKIKVCGMRDPDNILAVADLSIDLMGFIFYEKSPRYIDHTNVLPSTPKIKRVGVFVNSDIDFILEKIKTYKLDYLQLHGDETPEYCRDIQKEIEATRTPALKGKPLSPTLSEAKGIQLIKAFRVNEDFDFNTTKNYEKYCAYFLFDTKKTVTNAVHPPAPSKGGDVDVRGFSLREKYPPLEGAQGVEYGGTGKKFNWEILKRYTGNTPFLLSGGIGANDAKAVQNFSHPQFAGIDLNSKFEIDPALKNIPKIEDFLNVLEC